MKNHSLSKTAIAFILTLLMTLGSTASAQGESNQAAPSITPEVDSTTLDNLESDVAEVAEDATADHRSRIIQEAVDALAETKVALTALDEHRVDDALEALAMVTGKLKIIVARDPSLALAPTDVSYALHDIYSDRESIEIAIEEAQEALRDGRVQVARSILGALASELVINVSHLPLATYPDAIAAIVPLIDEGKLEEAKSALQSTINTLVVKEIVLPMPVVRAGLYLDLAEGLAEKSDRSEDENSSLDDYLSTAKRHLEMSEVLGYGNQENYSDLYAQLDDIESKVSDGKSGRGFFNLLRKSMDEASEES